MKPLVLITAALCLACGAKPPVREATAASGRYYRMVAECSPTGAQADSCAEVEQAICKALGCGAAQISRERLLPDMSGVSTPKAWTRYWRFEWKAQRPSRSLKLGGLRDAIGADAIPPRVGAMARPSDTERAWAGLAEAQPPQGPGKVIVALIDTAAPGPALAAGTHGADLGALLQAGVCGPDQACLKLAHHQALDLRPDRPAPAASEDWAASGRKLRQPTGVLPTTYRLSARTDFDALPAPEAPGAFGDPGQVARAVWQAVAPWLLRNQRQPEAARDALVLVLPIGWRPRPGGPTAGSRAAKAVLDYAIARGAHVVMAYGNRELRGGAGPLAPAAFYADEPAFYADERADDSRWYVVGGVQGVPALQASVASRPKCYRPAASTPCVSCAGGPAFAEVAPIPNQRPWPTRARPGQRPLFWAWGRGIRLQGRAAWTGTSTAAVVFAGALVRGLISGADGRTLRQRLRGTWVRFCDGDGTCPSSLTPAPRRRDGFERLPWALLTPATDCQTNGVRVPKVLTVEPAPAAGPELERVDPQPDTPVCDVCKLVQTGSHAATFKLTALGASWPANDETFDAFELKISYTDGTPAHYVALGTLTGTAPDYRHELDGTAVASVAVTLAAPFAKLDQVTLVGVVDHKTYQGPRTIFEPVDVP